MAVRWFENISPSSFLNIVSTYLRIFLGRNLLALGKWPLRQTLEMLWVGPAILNFTGISILVFDFWLFTELWIFGWLMGKITFLEFFCTCALELVESVNDSSRM